MPPKIQVPAELEALTDDQLRARLREYDPQPPGPINALTRHIYLKKLTKFIAAGPPSVKLPDSTASPRRQASRSPARKPKAPAPTPSPRTVSAPSPPTFAPRTSPRVSPTKPVISYREADEDEDLSEPEPSPIRLSPRYQPQQSSLSYSTHQSYQQSQRQQQQLPSPSSQETRSEIYQNISQSPSLWSSGSSPAIPKPRQRAVVQPRSSISPIRPGGRGSLLSSYNSSYGSTPGSSSKYVAPTLNFTPQNQLIDDDDDDDDHQELSRYLPRKQPKESPFVRLANSPRRAVNAATAVYRRSPLSGVISSGVAIALTLAIVYTLMPKPIDNGLAAARDGVRQLFVFSFNYAVIPALVIALAAAIGLAINYYIKRRNLLAAENERRVTHMTKEVLSRIRRGGSSGIPIKQLRDSIVPAYKRTKADLDIWNEVEAIIRYEDTRVRIEDRLMNGDEAVEHFVWVAAGLEDEYEIIDPTETS